MRSMKIMQIIDAVVDEIIDEHQPLSHLVPQSWGYGLTENDVDFRVILHIDNAGGDHDAGIFFTWQDLVDALMALKQSQGEDGEPKNAIRIGKAQVGWNAVLGPVVPVAFASFIY